MTSIVTPPATPSVPTYPALGSPTFNAEAYAYGSAMPGVSTGIGALAANAHNNAVAANERAVAADDSADAAAISQSAAAASAASAINAPGTQATSSTSMSVSLGAKTPTLDQTGKAFAVGQQLVFARSSAPATRMFARLDAFTPGTGAMSITVQTFEGSGGPYTDWIVSLGTAAPASIPDLPRVVRTSNTALVDADKGKWIDITSGSFTQTFGSRTAGWWCLLGNSGTGDIGLTTDGVTYSMYPQEKRYVIYDGTNDYTIVLNAYYRTFTTSGTWTKAPGYRFHGGEVDGTGGSGRRGAAGSVRTGGAGGGRSPFLFPSSALSATESIVLGTPGAAVTTNDTNGVDGGNCSFKTVVSQGGKGGSASAAVGGAAYYSAATALNNPVRTGANVSSSFDEGSEWFAFYGGGGSRINAAARGYAVYGGGAGDSIDASNALIAGLGSLFGAQGGTTNAAGTSITAGTGPGAGGAASTNGTNSGAGIRGEVRIWGVI